MAQSGTLSTSNYHTDVDALRSNLQTHLDAIRLGKQKQYLLDLRTVSSATALALRSLVWVPEDDAFIRALVLEGSTAASTADATARLQAIVDAGTAQANLKLPDDKLEVSASGISTGVTQTRTRWVAPAGKTPAILAGTPYRLELEVTSGTTDLLRALLVVQPFCRR